jgi:hypothetical protein
MSFGLSWEPRRGIGLEGVRDRWVGALDVGIQLADETGVNDATTNM